MTKVVFPCDRDAWWKVKDGLCDLNRICTENDEVDLDQLAANHQNVVNIIAGEDIFESEDFALPIWDGLVTYLRYVASEEDKNHFVHSTLPNIIEVALKVEELLPAEGVPLSVQQSAETRALSRQLCCSILGCAFLCLFPEDRRSRKLNKINFSQFFKHLTVSSQQAKLKCILHYFDRACEKWQRLTGSVLFTRQVVKRDELPTLDTWLNCSAMLCPVEVNHHNLIEEAGCGITEVDFANKYIGGGTLSRGRVQEEIRFVVCPELIVSMMFMEVMEENEAIIIQGYEQFSLTQGYAAQLKYACDFKDEATLDKDGNLRRMLCAIDAVSYRHDNTTSQQYSDHCVLRDLNKSFTGFCTPFVVEEDTSRQDEESMYNTVEEFTGNNMDSNNPVQRSQIDQFVEALLANAVSLAVPEAAKHISPGLCKSEMEETTMSHLEVNFRDWYAHYRRRSSNLSDLSSRRSSYDVMSRRSSGCSTRGYSSEFSSEFEEYYDNFQQQQYKYHTIKEEVGSTTVNEYASSLVIALLREGSKEACRLEHGVQSFHGDRPQHNITVPQPIRHTFQSPGEETGDSVNEMCAKLVVERLFKVCWPFNEKYKEEISFDCDKPEMNEKEIIQQQILCEWNNCGGTLTQSSDIDSEEEEVENNTAASGKGVENIDEAVLSYVAERIVALAFDEALVEYHYRYVNRLRKFEAQLSTESSQSDHSNDNKDHSNSLKLTELQKAENSGPLNRSPLKYNQSAETVAENMMSMLFGTDGESKESRGSSSNIVLPSSCDTNSFQVDNYGEDKQQSIDKRPADNRSKPTERRHEMYSRIADKLIVVGFSSITDNAFVDACVDSDKSSSCSSKVTSVKGKSNEQAADEEESVDQSAGLDAWNYRPLYSSSPLDSDPLASHLVHSLKTNNTNKMTSGLKTGGNLSKRSSERSKSRKLLEKRQSTEKINSSSSSEGKSAIDSRNSSFSNNSSCTSDKERMKLICDNSFTSKSHLPESEPTGPEPSPYVLPSAGMKNKHATYYQGARPKTHLYVRENHHIVGGKKNYDQFANSLSRDLLTNAFLQVQEQAEQQHVTYPRRSSEPMQISNGAALQRLENSRHIVNGKQTQKSKTDEDIYLMQEEWAQHGAFCGTDYRGNRAYGFRDPVLSRFAEELMKANVSVPMLQLLSDCVSTSGSSRSVCSTVSSFRDPILASFEEELINSNILREPKYGAKTQMSWSKMKGSVCSQRLDRRGSQNSNYKKQRVKSASVESEMSAISWKSIKSNSVTFYSEELSDFAEMLARWIVCESVSTVVCLHLDGSSSEGKQNHSRISLNMFSELLACSILKLSMSALESQFGNGDWLEQSKIVTWSDETECLEYSGEDKTNTSDTDSEERCKTGDTDSGSSSLEYEDALDVPFTRLEEFANILARNVLINSVAISQREQMSAQRRQYGWPIATGNWGCGAFCGDPHLKSLIQWMAASYAGTPHLLFFTFNHPMMVKFQIVVDTIQQRGWDVAKLMQAVRRYCMITELEMQTIGRPSHDLFDVILQGEFFPSL